jgi:hypothetical protein
MKKLTDKHIGKPQIIGYVENRVFEIFGRLVGADKAFKKRLIDIDKTFEKLGLPQFNLIDPIYRAIRHEINQSKI